MASVEATIGGVLVPPERMESLVDDTQPVETSKRALDGTLYTDFTTNTRRWRVKIAFLCADDYDDLRQVYFSQYNNAEFPVLEIPFYGVSAQVKMSMNEKDVRHDGDDIVGIELVLEEAGAVS